MCAIIIYIKTSICISSFYHKDYISKSDAIIQVLLLTVFLTLLFISLFLLSEYV